MRASFVCGWWPMVLAGAALGAGCATATPEGAKVKVYEANLKLPPDARRLPDGCRLVLTSGPVDQMESERLMTDPYGAQRNHTAAKGGNVLLVLSDRYKTLNKTDCAPSDTSVDCQSRAQNWYQVMFESYACDASSLEALATLQPTSTGVASWWPFGKEKPKAEPVAASAPPSAGTAPSPAPSTQPVASAAVAGIAPSELEAKVLVLMREGVGTDVIVAYVKSRPVSASLTAEEILDWKKLGIADSVIEAALAQATPAR